MAPRKPTEDSFAELVELVRNHVSPPPSAVVQRFHLIPAPRRTARLSGNSWRNFVGCPSSVSLDLPSTVCCGTASCVAYAIPEFMQRRLLSEVNLTFSKAFELAKAAELAEKSVADLQRPVDTASVHAVQPVPPSSVSCHRCGGKHNASSCRVKSAVCYNCGKPGAFRSGLSECSKKRTEGCRETIWTGARGNCKHLTLFTVKDPSQTPLTLAVTINGADLVMEVDTSISVYHQ